MAFRDIKLTDDWEVFVALVGFVLKDTMDSFAAAFDDDEGEPILVYRQQPIGDAQPAPPIALFDRIDGRIAIGLNTRSGRWAQYVYQFAHEFCHVLSNYRRREPLSFLWIDEVLSETASWFAIASAAERWIRNPPPTFNATGASIFRDYLVELEQDPKHNLPADVPFVSFVTYLLPTLMDHAELRPINTVIARRLLPIFLRDHTAWRAVRQLNKWDEEPPSISAYFEDWRSRCDEREKFVVAEIAAALGVSL